MSLVDSDVTGGVITTRSNRMKFRLFKVDRLQSFLVAKKDISTCRNCSSVGRLKCLQVCL